MENVQALSAIITEKDKEINSLKAIIKDLQAQVTYHTVDAKCQSLMYADRTALLHKERAEALADRVAILGPDSREKYLALFLHYNALLDSTDREKAVQLSKAAKPTKPTKKKALATRQQGLF